MDEQPRNPWGFENLEVYQAARAFRNRVYKLAKLLPPEEKYSLSRQTREAAVSVTANIAEGHGRHNWQDNAHFCRVSRGSLYELADHINTCIDQEYAKREYLEDLKSDGAEVLRKLNGYISYLERKARENSAPRPRRRIPACDNSGPATEALDVRIDPEMPTTNNQQQTTNNEEP